MRIYLAHSSNCDYINTIYKPILNDPELSKIITLPHMEKDNMHNRNYYEDFDFVITLDGKIIGGCDCDLSHSEDHSYATLGWIINKNYRGKGYASQAGAALIDFAFTNLKIDRI